MTGHFTADDKVYDGTTDATILTRNLTGAVSGDDVSLVDGSASFDTKHVGLGKAVVLSGASLTGADAGNYTLDSVVDTTADITAKELTGHFIAYDKVYDGNTDATVTDRSLTGGIVTGDDVSLVDGSASFADKHVGAGKTVTGTGFALGGADIGDYSLASSTLFTTADITAKELAGHFTAADKVYDGNTDATILTRTLTGVVAGDDVSLVDGSASFGTKHVGTGKTVTGTGFASGRCRHR